MNAIPPVNPALVIPDKHAPKRHGSIRLNGRLYDLIFRRGKWRHTGNHSPDYGAHDSTVATNRNSHQ